MKSRERVFASMLLEEADRVPIDEELWTITFDRILGGKENKSYIDQVLYVRKRVLDLDVAVLCGSIWGCLMPYKFRENVIERTKERMIYRDPHGVTWITFFREGREIGRETVLNHPIKEYDQLESFEFAVPDIVERYNEYKKGIDILKKYFFVMGEVLTPFECAYRLRGHEKLLKDFYLNPKPLKKLFMKCHRYIMEIIKILVELQVDGMELYGDIAYAHGPMISPKHHQEFLVPLLKEEVSYCRKKGVLTRFHSDGNIVLIIPHLIEIGFDAIDPIERKAGMDLSLLKERFGDEICLVGGINDDILVKGTPEDVRNEVKRCIETAAQGGGYILHSSGSIGPDIPLRNLFAMVEAGKKFGRYSFR